MHSESEQVVTEGIAELLKDNSFLYEDLAPNDPQKAFHGNFVIHLLATTYIPSIKGHACVKGLDTHVLAFCGIKGILGLCCAVVPFFFLNLMFLDAYPISQTDQAWFTAHRYCQIRRPCKRQTNTTPSRLVQQTSWKGHNL